jgi:cytochrome c
MRPWIFAFIVVAVVLSVGFVHPFGDPHTEPAKGLGTLLQDSNMPAAAKTVLLTKCADCHSNETRWPAYAQIPPGSWLIERDIVEARKKMNLSEWAQMPPERQQVLKAKIVQEVKSGDMPPLQYLVLHWNAKISSADLQAISTLSKSTGASEAALGGEGDATHGKLVFEKRCTGCHALEVDREGPRLEGVFGRKAGSVPGFSYSTGLKGAGFTWNEAMLERWLSDPDQVVPDNNMSFSVPKAEERRDLIAFLKR